MLSEALAALAATAGAGIVTAMATDGWQAVRARTATLLGRGNKESEDEIHALLEQHREETAEAPPEKTLEIRARQAMVWEGHVGDLLAEVPDSEAEVRRFVGFVGQRGVATQSADLTLNVSASGRAQQAVQGHGFQTNTFTQSD